jgi:N-methylhydantoinase A/oxoprolinase/acetone carboxylase beta subunit
VIRLGLPATAAVPPFSDWPGLLVAAVGGHVALCHGGYEFDGGAISAIDPGEIQRAALHMGEQGIRSVAITGVFSPLSAECELEAAALVADVLPEAHLSLSHQIGRIGLLERENATIVNACLRELAEHIVAAFGHAVARAGIDAPVFVSQNDGTLMGVDDARRYPVRTFASGPTNSMRGAAFLSGLKDCIVVDVGGTTTDVGVVTRGFPRLAGSSVELAGVRTNFRMPDVLSIGIGGGSLVKGDPPEVRVGPESVGHELRYRSLVFGGDAVTATDIAVAGGLLDLGDPALVRTLGREIVAEGLAVIGRQVTEAVDRMRTSAAVTPWVLVGGGSALVPPGVSGDDPVVCPPHFAVANAVGAAIAQVGGEVDRVLAVPPHLRQSVLDDLRAEAVRDAVAAGARPGSVEVVEVDEVPLTYLPDGSTRVRVKAVGDLDLDRPRPREVAVRA